MLINFMTLAIYYCIDENYRPQNASGYGFHYLF